MMQLNCRTTLAGKKPQATHIFNVIKMSTLGYKLVPAAEERSVFCWNNA